MRNIDKNLKIYENINKVNINDYFVTLFNIKQDKIYEKINEKIGLFSLCMISKDLNQKGYLYDQLKQVFHKNINDIFKNAENKIDDDLNFKNFIC